MATHGLGSFEEIETGTVGASRFQTESASSDKSSRDILAVAFPQPQSLRTSGSVKGLRESQGAALWKSTRLAIKTKGKFLLLESEDILAVESQGNYVLLQETKGSHLLRMQISVLTEKLHPYGIIRVNRSLLVNCAHIMFLEPVLGCEYLLRMRGGRVFKASRTYRKNLQLIAGLWIGASL